MSKLISFLKKLISSSLPRQKVQTAEPKLQTYDVTSCAADVDIESLEVVQWAPVWMTRAERLLLYTLIFGLRPARYLEIGTLEGGSALIVAAAMDALESKGQLVCIDPKPQIKPETWERLKHRTHLIEGFSPQALPEAQEIAGDPFDFVLIDGDHTHDGVLRDAEGLLPFVTDGAYLLFHDSFHPEIARALHEFSTRHASQVVDFGSLTREITLPHQSKGALPWGGLRLMQVRRNISAC
jgi:predicted O-methyltransferase YrrM